MKSYAYPRPGYVTLLGVILLVRATFSLLAFFSFTANRLREVPGQAAGPPIYFGIALLGTGILYAIWAAFLLRGANWARILYYALGLPIFVALTWLAVSLDRFFFPDFVINLIILACCYGGLAQHGANRFFTGRSTFFKTTKAPKKEGFKESSRKNFDY